MFARDRVFNGYTKTSQMPTHRHKQPQEESIGGIVERTSMNETRERGIDRIGRKGETICTWNGRSRNDGTDRRPKSGDAWPMKEMEREGKA